MIGAYPSATGRSSSIETSAQQFNDILVCAHCLELVIVPHRSVPTLHEHLCLHGRVRLAGSDGLIPELLRVSKPLVEAVDRVIEQNCAGTVRYTHAEEFVVRRIFPRGVDDTPQASPISSSLMEDVDSVIDRDG